MARRFKRGKHKPPSDSQAPHPSPDSKPRKSTEPEQTAPGHDVMKPPESDEIWDSLALEDAEETEPERGDFCIEPLEDDE
jgi:hypothetical protein